MDKDIILTPEEKELIYKYRNGYKGIYWHVNDFELQALALETIDKNKKFNRDKFQEAFDKMIRLHDASIGITWETVIHYLETYCLM